MIPKSHSVHPLPFCRGVEPSTKFSKKGGVGLTGPQLLEVSCWERGDDFFQGGGLDSLLNYRSAWQERRRWCFWGGVDTPMRTMRVLQNLKRKLFFVSKLTRIWWILIWALKSLKKLHFDWSLLCKVYNVWPKKVQRSIFHDKRVTQNLNKNWPVVWKMTWGI